MNGSSLGPLDPEQQLIRDRAQSLLDALVGVVPRTTMHYAVTDLQDIHLPVIMRLAGTIKCTPGTAATQLDEGLKALIAQGLTLSSAIKVFSEHHASDESAAYIEAARTTWAREGEIEIDEHSVTSGSDDDGDYVLAWVWVNNADAGLTNSDDEDEDEDEDSEEGGFTFELDYGVHVNGDGEALISARNLEVGDTFSDPAYDAPGEWHTIEQLWITGDTVHIDEEKAS